MFFCNFAKDNIHYVAYELIRLFKQNRLVLTKFSGQ